MVSQNAFLSRYDLAKGSFPVLQSGDVDYSRESKPAFSIVFRYQRAFGLVMYPAEIIIKPEHFRPCF